jgi:hypothetical protein
MTKRNVQWKKRRTIVDKILNRQEATSTPGEDAELCATCRQPIGTNAYATDSVRGRLCLGCFGMHVKREMAARRGDKTRSGR